MKYAGLRNDWNILAGRSAGRVFAGMCQADARTGAIAFAYVALGRTWISESLLAHWTTSESSGGLSEFGLDRVALFSQSNVAILHGDP